MKFISDSKIKSYLPSVCQIKAIKIKTKWGDSLLKDLLMREFQSRGKSGFLNMFD